VKINSGFIWLLALGVAAQVWAQAPPAPPTTGAAPPTPPDPGMAGMIKSLGDGRYELGPIRISTKERSLSFAAVVNAWEGPIEYLLVSHNGKTHESVLRTEVQPNHIHVAVLLLSETNAPGTPPPLPPGPPPAATPAPAPRPLAHPSKEKIAGEPVSINVTWESGGKTIQRSAGTLFRKVEGPPLQQEQWRYNGSRLDNGHFLAQLEGSIISLVTDPSALINNVAEGHDNDQIWRADTNNLPPLKTPVTVTITLSRSNR